MKSLRLTADEATALIELLTDHQARLTELAKRHAGDRDTWTALCSEQKDALDADLRGLLGPEKFGEFREYRNAIYQQAAIRVVPALRN